MTLPASQALPRPEIAAARQRSILVVDDNLRVSEEVCIVLEKAGWHVRCADDADAFRKLMIQQTPDIVLLDLNLPGEDGISLCKWLRSTYEDLSIVMLTARVMGSERTDGYVAGADVYLTKPTRPEELLAVVRNLSKHIQKETRKIYTPGPWTLQLKDMRLISPQSDTLSLTPNECIFLHELALTLETCSYEKISAKLGSEGSAEKSDKTRLEVLVSRLRTKLVKFGSEGLEIKTVYGTGYKMIGAIKLHI